MNAARSVPEDPPPPGRVERFLRPIGERSIGDERVGLLIKALLIAVALVWIKWILHQVGWEPVESIVLVTSLLAGTVFTLAILLAATLQDYKESERIVGELVSSVRRLHWDLQMIRADAPLVREADMLLLRLVRRLNQDLKRGASVKLTDLHRIIEGLDGVILRFVDGGRAPVARTAQVGLGNMVRIVDRLEVIVETSFTRAGYYFGGVATLLVIAALALTEVQPFAQGLLLFGFISFLLMGLFLLIWDLDNPFTGHARISTYQLDKVEAFIERQVAGPQSAAPLPAEVSATVKP